MEQTNLITAVLAALEQHIKTIVEAQVAAALAAQPKPETEAVVDMDKLRELVTPMITEIVQQQTVSVVEEAIDAHCSDYDHEEYDSAVNTLSEYDLDYFVTHDDIKAKVEEAVDAKVDDVLDDKIEDKARELLRNASISIDV